MQPSVELLNNNHSHKQPMVELLNNSHSHKQPLVELLNNRSHKQPSVELLNNRSHKQPLVELHQRLLVTAVVEELHRRLLVTAVVEELHQRLLVAVAVVEELHHRLLVAVVVVEELHRRLHAVVQGYRKAIDRQDKFVCCGPVHHRGYSCTFGQGRKQSRLETTRNPLHCCVSPASHLRAARGFSPLLLHTFLRYSAKMPWGASHFISTPDMYARP